MQTVYGALMQQPLGQTDRQKCFYVIMEKWLHENVHVIFNTGSSTSGEFASNNL